MTNSIIEIMSRIRLIFTLLYIKYLILEAKKKLRNKTNAVALIYAHAFDIRFGLKAKENLYWQRFISLLTLHVFYY